MENRLIRLPRHETLPVSFLLAMVGGFLDAYTYLIRGGVFANAQTGNIVLLCISAAQGEVRQAGFYAAPIAAFFFGVLLAEGVKKYFTNYQFLMWEHVILIIEIILLFWVGFCPVSVPNGIINVTVSFVCSVQVNSFRKVHNLSYASTMCTGNLRSAAEHFFIFLTEKEEAAGRKAGGYFLIILFFGFGAAVGTVLSGWWNIRAVWFCAALLLCAFGLMLKKE